jgi:hypothetical protein
MNNVSGPVRSVAIALIAALTIGGIALILVALSGANVAPALRSVSFALLATGLMGLVSLTFSHLIRKYTMPGLYWFGAGLLTAIGLIILLISISRS